MRLQTVDYAERQDTAREWTLSELSLGQINLIVGKNASGKSRTLNIIANLGKLLAGTRKPAEITTGTYKTTFSHEGRTLCYDLDIKDHKVVSEEFRDGDRVLLKRGAGGVGTLFHFKEGKDLEFQAPESDAAVAARRDTLQHPFLTPLAEWGEGVRHYEFGGAMGRTHIALVVQDGPVPDPRDVNAVVALFRRGAKEFPNQFATAVKRDMSAVGYPIIDVGTMVPTDVKVQLPVGGPLEPLILYVLERDLQDVTQQTEMSQGMFRALSVIIHITYAALASRPSCIIVDDIGEGIDFDRSCKLINLIRDRARDSDVQLILSTNDKFVMNEVPLEEWSILQRQGSHVRVRNKDNAREEFEHFRFVGMSNFTFFEMDFISGTPQMEAVPARE